MIPVYVTYSAYLEISEISVFLKIQYDSALFLKTKLKRYTYVYHIFVKMFPIKSTDNW